MTNCRSIQSDKGGFGTEDEKRGDMRGPYLISDERSLVIYQVTPDGIQQKLDNFASD